ncbi:MAG: ChrR family anti-sigma-E factor [Oceanospirillaceae bacterium]
MNINHHLDEATLVSYAAGAMSQSMALVVACHISMCNVCRDRVYSTEAIGGMLLESLEPAAISEDALNKLLARLDEEPIVQVSKAEERLSSTEQDNVPAPLNDFIGNSLNEINWKSILPGIHYYDISCKTEFGGVSRLLRISPGKSMLLHSHEGNELTLILRGSITDEVGRFTVGDIADLDSDIEHQPLVDGDEDCICLVATDAPLKFKTLLGKIVQPITGF